MVLLWLSLDLIDSKMDYGSIVCDLAKNTNLSLLDLVHNNCIRLTAGALRINPLESQHVESGKSLLILWRNLLFINYAAKLLTQHHHPS
jgi:hypothetical protein